MSLLRDEVEKALGDNPLDPANEGAAVDRAKLVLSNLLEALKPEAKLPERVISLRVKAVGL